MIILLLTCILLYMLFFMLPQDGWHERNGITRYYLDWEPVTGWQDIDGNRYYFGEDGILQTHWQDIDGNDIQAHGGCIIEHEGTYYWYGEHKGEDNCPGTTRVDVIGVSCYSSKNLHDWKYEGLALESDKNDPESPLYYKKVLERPKVIYNEKNNNFVLWAHADSADYVFGGVAVAVSDDPTGPFKFLYAKQPNKQDSRDMTIFKDVDGRRMMSGNGLKFVWRRI